MPKTRKKKKGDVGIRLKPIENNLLENYNEFSSRRKKTRKKKKKKIKKPKKTTKSIEIHKNKDPLLEIIGAQKEKKQNVNEIQIKELDDETDNNLNSEYISEIKKVKVEKKAQDLSETDPNVKKLTITASIEPEKKKKGHNVKLE
jgi:hypothetical protein|tara:strand:+ start:672 stop:1106 length:435 start_codon:yes stop_codon:yes gene_type:complete